YCQILYCPPRSNFAFATVAVSAEKRDYEEVFIACQVSVAYRFAFLPRPLQPLSSLAAIEISG
ncbi:hypothetical protein, partial [Achromobacter sp. HZ01]|uniref:hypothetical protein n=1 Tax=Achromobacter sp. HZ01 TaxID=1416886 RepID=UPI001AEFA016